MELKKENFSNADQLYAEEVAKIAIEGIGAEVLSREEYVELVAMLEQVVLADLYNRRYKNS